MRNRRIPATLAIMVLLLMLFCGPAFAEGASELTAEEAAAIALDDMRAHSGLTEAEIANFHLRLQELGDPYNGTRYWTNVFACDITGMEYWVQVDYRTGHVYNTDHPDYAEEYRHMREMAEQQAIAHAAQAELEQEKGPYPFWSYQDKAGLYAAYPGALPRHIPGPDDMREAEAISLAAQEMARLLLADEAYLNAYRLDTGFSNAFYWGNTPAPTWHIVYRYAEPSPEGQYPVRHQVLINAETGDILLLAFEHERRLPVSADLYRDTLYRNPNGGIYFHYDAKCWSVDEALLPLTPFARAEILRGDDLLSLLPCQRCVYHDDGDWGSDWVQG